MIAGPQSIRMRALSVRNRKELFVCPDIGNAAPTPRNNTSIIGFHHSAILAGRVCFPYGYNTRMTLTIPYEAQLHTGFGRDMGHEALDLYTNTKSVWVGL